MGFLLSFLFPDLARMKDSGLTALVHRSARDEKVGYIELLALRLTASAPEDGIWGGQDEGSRLSARSRKTLQLLARRLVCTS